jgi:hypothetical protein
MADTRIGSGEKAHASDAAKTAFDAMMTEGSRSIAPNRYLVWP